MAEEIDWEQVPDGSRVIYTKRSGDQVLATTKDKIKISSQSGWMINIVIDGDTRERNYVPADMLTLVPTELSDTLG